MGDIYEKIDFMLGEIRDVMVNNNHVTYHEKIEEILMSRWEKMEYQCSVWEMRLTNFIITYFIPQVGLLDCMLRTKINK